MESPDQLEDQLRAQLADSHYQPEHQDIESSNDANSIIIDTKVNNDGIPVLTPEQMEEYLKRALGEEYDSSKIYQSKSQDNEKLSSNQKVSKSQSRSYQMQMHQSLNLQSRITQILFGIIATGNIQQLKLEQAHLGFK